MSRPGGVYYPICVDLRGRKCVVVGGGAVAERKVADLVASGAEVTVISPQLTSALNEMKGRGEITHVGRKYRSGDLKGAFLCIAATDLHEENSRVAGAAPSLVNVVDAPELCTFIVPATLRRGSLSISVSTSGASPAMAREIRNELEVLYGPAFGRYLEELAGLRERALAEIASEPERKEFLDSLASRDIISMVRGGMDPLEDLEFPGTAGDEESGHRDKA